MKKTVHEDGFALQKDDGFYGVIHHQYGEPVYGFGEANERTFIDVSGREPTVENFTAEVATDTEGAKFVRMKRTLVVEIDTVQGDDVVENWIHPAFLNNAN